MAARALMVQGTASHVGKSVIVAGLCRHYARRGFRVAPFKAQNMSLNAYVTADGLEIGRAQAVQAQAAMVEVTAEMNPILLKPEGDQRSQVVVLGRPWRSLPGREYYRHRSRLWAVVRRSLRRLLAEHDLVIIEGAGSPAEINLRRLDLVNMAVAREADAPILLVGDIDRGGVFASLFGTLALLPAEDRDRIRGLVINKFPGDPELLTPGLLGFELLVGVPILGVVPHAGPLGIAEEDSVALDGLNTRDREEAAIEIAAIRLPHLANHDDLDSLRLEPRVRLRWVGSSEELGRPHAVILPGSKTTMDDLRFLQTSGLAGRIQDLARGGCAVVGLCGGYQMLGRRLLDPLGVESSTTALDGLGLLPVDTAFQERKETRRVRGRVTSQRGFFARLEDSPIEGYEIHMGRTAGGEGVLRIAGDGAERWDGTADPTGRIWGTYLHGIFDNTELRRAWLESLGWRPGTRIDMGQVREEALEAWAALLAEHLDMAALDRLLELC